MWSEYYNITNVEEALTLLSENGERARIVAGGTDLIIEIERGVRKGIDILIDITRTPGLDKITIDENDVIHLGPNVTHNDCVSSKIIRERAFPLALASWEVGAPQIRNRGTIAGNLITASPANDTIAPLIALDANVILSSIHGERIIPLQDFYLGVRKTVMQPYEMLLEIQFPAMQMNQRGTFQKIGLRRAQAISVVNAAVVLSFPEVDSGNLCEGMIEKSSITLGSVAPIIIHASEAEKYLEGKRLTEEVLKHTAKLAINAAAPIDDVRSSADYRSEMVRVSVLRALRSISRGDEEFDLPIEPVMLWGDNNKNIYQLTDKTFHQMGSPIYTTINGKEYEFSSGYNKTLLRLLREEAGLIGTKEGCAEGECGACTVFLDGEAVMSCLVPAARAHGAQIVTIEGLADGDKLHPVQQAFIEDGAVQCGYCTPGFIMSAVKLLEEKPHPTKEDIKQAITGNLCRCTGYYKIIEAIEHASVMKNTG
jgi:xanthine dehydrogenase iron-sulfur cluster and FAD-binding subunit A